MVSWEYRFISEWTGKSPSANEPAYIEVIDVFKNLICTLEDDRIEDARLIAAAPDLLEVCIKIVEYAAHFGSCNYNNDVCTCGRNIYIAMARKAIADARGG